MPGLCSVFVCEERGKIADLLAEGRQVLGLMRAAVDGFHGQILLLSWLVKWPGLLAQRPAFLFAGRRNL